MMLIVLSILFLMSSQPILMIISLILITLLYSLYLYFMMSSYWYSYALILVMLSGILVVFTYMISIMPNESFEVYSLILFMIVMFFFLKYNFFEKIIVDLISLNLWMSYIGVFILFMVSFLLMLMIMVVWLSCMIKGAIRVM